MTEEIKELKSNIEELKSENEERHSIAYEIIQDYKKTNQGLIIANIIQSIVTILAIIGFFMK